MSRPSVRPTAPAPATPTPSNPGPPSSTPAPSDPELPADEACASDGQCAGGACGYDSFDPGASMVCCESEETIMIETEAGGGWFGGDGWPTDADRPFCTGRPGGTKCGGNDG